MEEIRLFGRQVCLHTCDALIIGSGCAAWNAADCLHNFGVKNIILVSEGLNMGTSRNTGSDKQTYYKLAIQSGQVDSVDNMAKALASGKSVNGDTAYVEAANSARCFMKLVELGVKFPTNEYGEYVGYQTDHTTTKRATSAGPLTSRYMTEALEKAVTGKGIPIMDGLVIVEILHDEEGVFGAIGILKNYSNESLSVHVFLTPNIICATGGPATVYENTVYPPSQTGMTGTLIDCGVECANLQEWQYGIASVKFRWNLSGTYQQVLPRYISIDAGGHEHEFLNEYFADKKEALARVFLKGYQWPFDYSRIDGSSLIDLLVYHEQVELGRKVFLDYRTNPGGLEDGFDILDNESREYLEKSGALFGTPIERLNKMNPDAIELYRKNGIDLYHEPLQITVAAQHNNGGAAVDINWESSLKGLYVAGEAAGTFGVYRPGGSALNSTQVGSLRVAEHISREKRVRSAESDMTKIEKRSVVCSELFKELGGESDEGCAEALVGIEAEMRAEMSRFGAHVRDAEKLESVLEKADANLGKIWRMAGKLPLSELVRWFKVRDMLIVQKALAASILYAEKYIGSRGGSFFCSLPMSKSENDELIESISALKSTVNSNYDDKILYYCSGKCEFRSARPMPENNDWFEIVWAEYKKRNSTK